LADVLDGGEWMRHFREETLITRVNNDTDRELINHGRRERLLGRKTLAHNSISRGCTGAKTHEQSASTFRRV
jgi:hypothetical protein